MSFQTGKIAVPTVLLQGSLSQGFFIHVLIFILCQKSDNFSTFIPTFHKTRSNTFDPSGPNECMFRVFNGLCTIDFLPVFSVMEICY